MPEHFRAIYPLHPRRGGPRRREAPLLQSLGLARAESAAVFAAKSLPVRGLTWERFEEEALALVLGLRAVLSGKLTSKVVRLLLYAALCRDQRLALELEKPLTRRGKVV